MLSLPQLVSLASLLSACHAWPRPRESNLDPTALDTYANNSLFLRWRPLYHFLAPAGHMNDPCGPMYDVSTDTYHLFYQSFPNHVQGGNGSWGHATSKDLITFSDVGGWQDTEPLALRPGPYPEYDWIGDWSGSAQPVSLTGQADGNLTAIFTCVKKLPVGWTADEERGSEQQCIATSSDGGVTWQKYAGNPFMSEPPPGWNFTGWRDPYFQPMPLLDDLLLYSEPHYYMVLGSGIHGAGPRMPLYTANASDLTSWTFLGALFDVAGNLSWGGDPFRTGSLGYNFELAGFNTFIEQEAFGGDGKSLHYVVNMGSEGGANSYHQNAHWSMFGLGSASRRENGSVALDLDVTAPLDWGNLYAATTFHDTKNDRRVLWGWSDEDMNGYGIRAQGFQGSLGLPRELFILKTHNVSAPRDDNTEAQPAKWTESPGGTYTVTTLGSRPLPEVIHALHSGKPLNLIEVCLEPDESKLLTGHHGEHFHLQATMRVDGSFSTAGFLIRATPDMEEYTRITYTLQNSTLTLDRTASSLVSNFTKTNYYGFFEPYTIHGTLETLNFDIFGDGSLIEIFINGRFAMTSRIYPTRADAQQISIFAGDGQVRVDQAQLWTNMKNDIFPDRPANSSSPLHFDPYYETHVTFENVEDMPIGFQLYDGY